MSQLRIMPPFVGFARFQRRRLEALKRCCRRFVLHGRGGTMLKSVKPMVMFVSLLAVPASAYAQAQASIVGTVRDASGAVLPGVSVEASSPVLIEKTRTVVTSGTGQYSIVDLRPGVYTVTFTLNGFSTVKREGIELTGAFIASVNAD